MSIGRDNTFEETQPSTPAAPATPTEQSSNSMQDLAAASVRLDTPRLKSSDSSGSLTQAPISVIAPARPVCNKLLSDFSLVDKLPKDTFHQVFKALKKNELEVILYYYKFNPVYKKNQSPSEMEATISELEAISAAYYKLLAPEITPDTHAVLNEKNEYVGVISKDNPHFKSIGQDPLKESDLHIQSIAERHLYIEMDAIEVKVVQLENLIEKTARILKKANENEENYKNRLRKLQNSDTPFNITKIEELSKQFTEMGERKTSAFLDNCRYTTELGIIFQDLHKKHGISKDEFDRFRMIKGLSIGLTASYIYMEDDLHQNNISKYGERIDFDMSLWPILYEFKESGVVDVAFRKPHKNAFDVTGEDILRFPNLIHAKPYFWPTKATLSQMPREMLKNFVSLSTNAYSTQLNTVFSKLETNPVFIHYKFATFFKFILIDPNIFRKIALLHMQEACTFKSRPVIDLLAQTMNQRTLDLTKNLLSLKEFIEFITQYGDAIYQQIISHFMEKNTQHSLTATDIDNTIHNLRSQSQVISEINMNLSNQLTDLANLIPSLSQSVVSESVGSPIISAKFLEEDKTTLLKQKLDERKIKCSTYETNETLLRDLAKLHDFKEAERAAHLSQLIDLDWIQKKYEDIIQEFIAKKKQLSDYLPQSLMTSMKGLIPFSLRQQSNSSIKTSDNPLRINYEIIKDKVISEMNLYINPGISGFMGFRRNHAKLANSLIQFALQNQPESEDPLLHSKAIRALQEQLEADKCTLEKTKEKAGMYNLLVSLLNEPEWNVLKPKVSMNHSISM